MNLATLRKELRTQASAERAAVSQRFFKTGPGEYGEGDQFLGLSVPQTRALVPQTDALSEGDVLTLLHSEWHEERLLALYILIRRFTKARKDEPAQQHLIELYLANTRWINNWDLVDTSAPHLLGAWLLKRDRAVLDRLAASPSLWEQRIAQVEAGGMRSMVEGTLGRWFTEPYRCERGDVMARIGALIAATPVAGYAACGRLIPTLDMTPQLPRIVAPTLVLVGEEDPGTVPAMAATIARGIPGARLELIPRASHLLNIEQADLFNELLLAFLGRGR